MKNDLSLLEFKDMNEYNDAEDSFIKKTEKLAVEWYQRQNQNKGKNFLLNKA